MSKDRQDTSAFERLLRDGDDEDIRRFLLILTPAELADILEFASEEGRLRLLRLMGAPQAAEVLRAVEEEDRDEIFEDLSAEERAEIVSESRSDDAADLVAQLPPEKQERTLARLDREDRDEIRELMQYGAETAGGIMQTEVVTVRGEMSVAEAIEVVRGADIEDVGEILEVFVVDSEGRLLGRVSPADLLQESAEQPVRTVMDSHTYRVPITMDQEEVAEHARENDLVTIPVVDDKGVLVGQILHDDIADVIEEEATEDIAKMAGTTPEEVYTDRVWTAVRARVPWLLPPFIGGLTVSVLMRHSSGQGAPAVYAAYLVVVVGMAGAVGTQNSAITVRSLALGRVELSRAWRFVYRQLLTAALLGAFFGLILFGLCVWYFNLTTSQAGGLGVAAFSAMVTGGFLGVTVPLALARFGFDPAVGASPFIQTVNDVVGAGILVWTAQLLGIA